jgi:hypothetical protein
LSAAELTAQTTSHAQRNPGNKEIQEKVPRKSRKIQGKSRKNPKKSRKNPGKSRKIQRNPGKSVHRHLLKVYLNEQ